MLLPRVLDAEAAADVEHGRRPAELVARPLAERCEPLDGDEALVDPGELRADVEVHAGDLESEAARLRDDAQRRVGAEAELRAVMGGPHRLVRDGFDARSQPHEHAAHAGRSCAGRLVWGIEDDRRPRLGCGVQLLVRLVVAVEEDPVARQACRQRVGELAQGGHVGADALVGEHLQERHVRERLRPVDDERARRRLPVGAGLGADRLLAVDDERRAVVGGEALGRQAAEAQGATVDPG